MGRAWLGLVAVLVLGGCTSEGSARTGTPLVEATRLLTVQDLPDGYELLPFEVAGPAAGTSVACRRVADVAVPSAAVPGLKVSFSRGPRGPYVTEQLRTSSDAAGVVRELEDALAACRRLELGEGADVATYRVAARDVPRRGDRALGIRLTARIGGVPFTSTTTVVRVGRSVAAVSLSRSGSGPGSEALLDRVVQRAVQRLEGTGA